jgi:chromosome partitioning protein
MSLAHAYDPPPSAATRQAHVIVVGNQKGGAGKSTVAMHIVVALMRMGRRTGVLDLDVSQRSLTRYIENRNRWIATRAPSSRRRRFIDIKESPQRSLDLAEPKRKRRFA